MQLTEKQASLAKELCNIVINESNNDYAKGYAKAFFAIPHTLDVVSWQLVDVASNLQYWRGERARDTKAKLRALIQELNEAENANTEQ